LQVVLADITGLEVDAIVNAARITPGYRLPARFVIRTVG
jgi:O-acetyl-ADP-ribose deacetylase (regulator of RNase III)